MSFLAYSYSCHTHHLASPRFLAHHACETPFYCFMGKSCSRMAGRSSSYTRSRRWARVLSRTMRPVSATATMPPNVSAPRSLERSALRVTAGLMSTPEG